MKLITFIFENEIKVGKLSADLKYINCFKLNPEQVAQGVVPLLELLAVNQALPEIHQVLELSAVKIIAPIPRPRRNIFCVGKNYVDHIHEVAASGLGSAAISGQTPEYPIFFSKVPETVIGPDALIESHATLTQQLDYEAELAIIIAKGGRAIPVECAWEHIGGYTILNDVSARDLQKRHQQWHLAKSLDSFCPMGPWVVAAAEFDPQKVHIQCWVNSELRQDAYTDQMIFNPAKIIASLSAGITLYPGDIIATGTPSGVGMGFKPPKFLKSGDEVKISISGIGSLINQVK